MLGLRARRLAQAITRHVQPGTLLLDVGCGDLRIGANIAAATGAHVRGIDLLDQNATSLPFQTYDGRQFPFPDNSFDTVLFCFVLHHSEEQDLLLAEARRVSRRDIILLEDTFDSLFGQLTTKIHDVIANKVMYPSISIPFTYRTREGWRALFEAHRLALVCEERIHSLPLNIHQQVLFRLSKTPGH
jgi:ubiquinone/menaquinone biosynthesis C-methylase UbiE